MKQLCHLLKLTEEELKREVYNYLQQKKKNPICKDGFVYAEGEIPILLVAHMDTVFYKPPKNLYYNKKQDKIYSPDGGIGGDDRCGVYAILKLLEKYKPYVLFTQGEEMGCIGATKAVNKLKKPDVKYIIEFDRKGSKDCVFYDCGNNKFINYIESFGFVTDYGSYSDISVLASKWDIAAVNLSSGYYNEHTENEYIIFKELVNTINRAENMLKEYKKAPYFDYQEIGYTSQTTYDNLEAELELLVRYFGIKSKNQISQILSPNVQSRKLVLKKQRNQKDNKGDKK